MVIFQFASVVYNSPASCRAGSSFVVLTGLDQLRRYGQCGEDLPVEQFVAYQAAIRFAGAMHSMAAGHDVT